jgi:alpha-methylacyl-CoA racemase
VTMSGPLVGMRVVEIAGMGPGPFAAMLFADLGAEVIRIERPASVEGPRAQDFLLQRGRPSVAVDLQAPDGPALVLRLVKSADALIEGFRPGVAERLGIGPDACLAVNRRLVYGRMTGWGQDGPYASAPGHDINYIAPTGALKAIGRQGGKPAPPLNLIGDFGGGGMLLAVGVLAAVIEARQSGLGQVVDAAMVDGAALLTTGFFSFTAAETWQDQLQSNWLDGGVPYYDVYETADDQYVAVGALERHFYEALLEELGLLSEFPDQYDRARWPDLRLRLTEAFRTRTRDEWASLTGHVGLCLSPVHSFYDAPSNLHAKHRSAYVEVDGVVQPAPAPRFSRTPGSIRMGPPLPGENTVEALLDWGLSEEDVAELRSTRTIRTRE